MKVYGITGVKNSGKTTLVERLVAEIAARGYSVSTVKHAHHVTDVDQPGRDSYRHREAGAREVMLASPRRWALMRELRDEAEPPLEELLARLSPVELVLVEGYKAGPHPKLEVHRAATGRAPLALANPTVRAVAADVVPGGLEVPVFDLDDIAAIADFILTEMAM